MDDSLNGFWIFPISFVIVLLTGVMFWGWFLDDELEPKTYDPMICYVMTAEGERVPCP